MEALSQRLESMDAKLAATQASVGALSAATAESRQETADRLADVLSEMDTLPTEFAILCPDVEVAPAAVCEEPPPVRTVVTTGDKMLVGELERIWIDPPGASFVAEVDTGASLSSIRTETLVPFERDGEDWVRFDLVIDKETTTLERQVKRHMRIGRQKDTENNRRPVIELRVRLGDIQDTFEFALVRSSDDRQLVLGRNFLKDIALVDVSRRYIQPPYRPAAD